MRPYFARKLTRRLCVVSVLSLLVWQGNIPYRWSNHATAQQRRQTVQSKTIEEIRQEREAQKREDYKVNRQMLLSRGVPFDPDTLLDEEQWRKQLEPILSGMPEMQESRRGAARLKGVHLAHTLYLPEKVELTGDTVLLVRNLIFEGRDILIKGHYNLSIFLIETVGALGTTLQVALARQREQSSDVRYSKLSFTGKDSMKLPAKPLPLIQNAHFTVDVSGEGYVEWLQKHPKLTQVRFRKAVFVSQQGQDISTDAGAQGGEGQPGSPAGTNSPDPANTGAPGFCSNHQSTRNGKAGDTAQLGLSGNRGGQGGPGNDATPAGTLNYPIPPGATGIWTFRANGGQGGQGGTGGPGSPGGKGTGGGAGGPGADCPCEKGGPGNGGDGQDGAPGGQGGPGGIGGQGGSGGNGGHLNISYPYGFNPSQIDAKADGGAKGPAGLPGQPGAPGQGGAGGDRGRGASHTQCSNLTSTDGRQGSSGGDLGFGGPGLYGELGVKAGDPGSVTLTPRDPPRTAGFCGGAADYGTYPSGCSTGYTLLGGVCTRSYTFQSRCAGSGYDEETCTCPEGVNPSPIIIDVSGNGFNLTNVLNGVNFDIANTGTAMHLAWTAA
jgi:hypothetical protein